jgi:PPK2 family polyphosphate:nucleotide phosphotransferase
MAVLKNISTKAPKEFDKEETKKQTEEIKNKLDDLQNLLYAESKHALLVVIQGMDASGKDGAIGKVFGGLNPQGIFVKSFKAPTEDELNHDFLWRIHQHVPWKGIIQVFNRSHYEDVLITRVHGLCDDEIAEKRFKAINHFERLLQEHNNTIILKFYLHVSAEEQEERLKERITNPAKNWKYNAKDLDEAKLWDQYMQHYEDVFANCNDPEWTIVPADQNWYKEFLIAKKLAETLESLEMKFPEQKNLNNK